MMAKVNILDLNVSNLFETHSINDILAIEKSIDSEIEHKRIELRSIVGDRYKDILTATEAIKSIESISETIVIEIQNVIEKCDALVKYTNSSDSSTQHSISKSTQEERTILMQIRLVIEINEHIWIEIDEENFCRAAQFYLLAQHVHTGLRLMKTDMQERYHLLSKLKVVIDLLRGKILHGSLNKLKNVELTIEETCSLLNTIMLLENHSTTELLNKFINIRKEALESVISESYSSVRVQIAAMVKCIYTSIQLLHDCFFNYQETKEGLIWKEITEIIGKTSPSTLSKIKLPLSNMTSYIPQIIKEFRPKCGNVNSNLAKSETLSLVEKLLADITSSIGKGLSQHLELVSSIKGLQLIREEALKIQLPKGWEDICEEINLARNFDVWYYFFQDFMTTRAKLLISKKITEFSTSLNSEITKVLKDTVKSNKSENDLRWYIWDDDNSNDHKILSMKTKGFSPIIVKLSENMDDDYLDLLKDVSLYLYGTEFRKEEDFFDRISSQTGASGNNKKFVDREKLETHLKQECVASVNKIISHLKTEINNSPNAAHKVTKSIICARFLTALTTLCPSFTKCCSCNQSSDEWEKICIELNKVTMQFWDIWIEDSNEKVTEKLNESFNITDPSNMLTILCKWDIIEIQEQTDENVFKSNIKIPMKSSKSLAGILDYLSEILNALFPHTLPKQVHLKFMEKNVLSILNQYEALMQNELNQMQALQFLFDVKFLTTLAVPRENMELVQRSQDVCDKFRSFVDPFDLDVFYNYLQHNVRQNALQTQVIYGCLLPSSNQLASLGLLEKNKEHEKDPSILAMSTPSNNNWFMLLPVTAPITKASLPTIETKVNTKDAPRKLQENSVRSGAAALFGAMTTDWFS